MVGDSSTNPGDFRFLVAGLFGLFVSLFLSKQILSWRGISLITAVCTFLACFQYVHQCPTCPHVTVLGVQSGIAGALCYGALFLGLIFQVPLIFAITTVVCAAIAAWQISQLLGGSGSCVPCELIFLLNFLVIGTAIASRWKLPQVPDRGLGLSSARLFLPVGFLGSSLIVLALFRPIPTASPKQSNVDSKAWVGVNLAKKFVPLGLNNFSGIVLFWKNGCYPCELARQQIGNEMQFPIREVQLNENCGDGAAGEDWVCNSTSLFPATPTTLVVRKGVVIREFLGWSSDPLYGKSILTETNLALSLVNKQKVNNNEKKLSS